MHFSNKFLQLALLAFLIAVSAGCDRKIEKMSNQELQGKSTECQNAENPSAAMGFACENYKRECDRRRKEMGRYIC